MTRTVAKLTVLRGALAAGFLSCAAPDPGGIDLREVWIPMPDGVRLAAGLYFPTDAADERFPVLLEYLPLAFQGVIDLSSDRESFHLVYTRRLHHNGELVREKTWTKRSLGTASRDSVGERLPRISSRKLVSARSATRSIDSAVTPYFVTCGLGRYRTKLWNGARELKMMEDTFRFSASVRQCAHSARTSAHISSNASTESSVGDGCSPKP